MTWTPIAELKGGQGDTGPMNPEQASRFTALESLVAEPGSRVENLAIDPLPVDAPSTYLGSRVRLVQAPGWGRATCDAVGAVSFHPLASTNTLSPDRYFSAKAGDPIAVRVIVRGNPTQAVGATLRVIGYTWNGSAFVAASVAPEIATAQMRVDPDARVTFEAAGTVPANSDMTHFVPQLTFRRWGETYPQVGDFVFFREWSVQAGRGVSPTTPVAYTDGTTDGAFWVGTPNLSKSIRLTPRRNDEAESRKRDMLVSAFRARRGGVIGTGGKAAVSLRFDHGLAKFKTLVLPLLQKYDLPWSQAVNPGNLTDSTNQSSYADVQSMALNNGGEVWNHGRDHSDATGTAAIETQIVQSLQMLSTGMPSLAIEGWAPPGIAFGGFDGYSPMQTAQQHYGTFAGRLAISNHAAVAGYIPGMHRTLPANLDIGLTHVTLDTQTPDWASSVLRGAVSARAGVQLMLHPVYLDTAGYMTTAALEQVFAEIASLRAAGKIDVLTPTGMLLADPTTPYRHNLLTNGDFGDGLSGWASSSGWTVSGGVASTTSGGPLSAVVSFSRQSQLTGGVRELIYEVRAPQGAAVRTAATAVGLAASKDHTLPANGAWVQVRKPFTVPLGLSTDLSVAIGRVSGGPVEVRNVRVQAI